MPTASTPERSVDLDVLDRSLKRIGLGWMLGVIMIASFGPLSLSMLIGGAFAVGGLRRLKTANLGNDVTRRCDELAWLVLAAVAAHAAGVVFGRPLLNICTGLAVLVAQLRFALMMRLVLHALGNSTLAGRWQAAGRVLLVSSSVISAVVLFALVAASMGTPPIRFVDGPSSSWVMAQPAEFTSLGVAIMLTVVAASIWQIVTLWPVFQPTKDWVEANRATDVGDAVAGPASA